MFQHENRNSISPQLFDLVDHQKSISNYMYKYHIKDSILQ